MGDQPFKFSDVPEKITCQHCGSKNTHRASASDVEWDIYASYSCVDCNKISCRSWSKLDRDDYPEKAKCPQCHGWAYPYEAGDNGRVIFQHATLWKIHKFELEYTDAGWGTYQGRAEIVRVYDTRIDGIAVPA